MGINDFSSAKQWTPLAKDVLRRADGQLMGSRGFAASVGKAGPAFAPVKAIKSIAQVTPSLHTHPYTHPHTHTQTHTHTLACFPPCGCLRLFSLHAQPLDPMRACICVCVCVGMQVALFPIPWVFS